MENAFKGIARHFGVWFVSMLLAAVVGAVTALTVAGLTNSRCISTVPKSPATATPGR